MKKNILNGAVWVLMGFVTFDAMACASCGCSLNSDWGTQGLSSQGGWSADIRYDYINQNQLRSGTGKISAAAAATTTNTQTNSPAEVEKFTKTQTVTATLDYNDGEKWGVSLVVPQINRQHSTLGSGGDGYSLAEGAYDSQRSAVGDTKIIGRYYGLTEQKNIGFQLGVKLPTGQKNQVGSNGDPLDPGLQLGTGTTDIILGVYHHDNWNDDWGYFSQAIYQRALNHSTMAAGSYRPGDGVNLNLGVRYEKYEWIKPTLQLNSRYVKSDSGDAADTYATGGTLVYLTPGAIFPVGQNTSIYSYVQVPIYQHVNGIQLTPRYIFSIGAKFSF